MTPSAFFTKLRRLRHGCCGYVPNDNSSVTVCHRIEFSGHRTQHTGHIDMPDGTHGERYPLTRQPARPRAAAQPGGAGRGSSKSYIVRNISLALRDTQCADPADTALYVLILTTSLHQPQARGPADIADCTHSLSHVIDITPRVCARVHAARVPHPTNTSTNGGQDRRGNATCVSHGRSLCARAAAGYCHSMPGTVVRSADTHRGCVRCWALFAVSVSMNKSSIAASSAAIAITEDVNTLLVARRSRAPSSA